MTALMNLRLTPTISKPVSSRRVQDFRMTARPKFELSRLREIGWAKWDPIGLCRRDCLPEDEYDSYLLQAAGRLLNGASQEEVANYLVSIEIEYMGLGEAPGVCNGQMKLPTR
jgi:hypothetical protein